MYKVYKDNKINLGIYDLNVSFNEYNKETLAKLNEIKDLLKNEYFEVPSYIRKMKWGEEIVFLPFTNKLFKIVSTIYNDTSIQLHPRKNEMWYPLKDSIIFNSENWVNVNTNQKVIIKTHSIHAMKMGSSVFEIQDNNLTDNDETIRLFDINGRDINSEEEILNYVLPQTRNHLKISNVSKYYLDYKNDLFVFVKDGENIFDQTLLEKNKLYFIKKEFVDKLHIRGKVVITPAEYYNIININDRYN